MDKNAIKENLKKNAVIVALAGAALLITLLLNIPTVLNDMFVLAGWSYGYGDNAHALIVLIFDILVTFWVSVSCILIILKALDVVKGGISNYLIPASHVALTLYALLYALREFIYIFDISGWAYVIFFGIFPWLISLVLVAGAGAGAYSSITANKNKIIMYAAAGGVVGCFAVSSLYIWFASVINSVIYAFEQSNYRIHYDMYIDTVSAVESFVLSAPIMLIAVALLIFAVKYEMPDILTKLLKKPAETPAPVAEEAEKVITEDISEPVADFADVDAVIEDKSEV